MNVIRDEDVCGFDIPVNDSIVVEICEPAGSFGKLFVYQEKKQMKGLRCTHQSQPISIWVIHQVETDGAVARVRRNKEKVDLGFIEPQKLEHMRML